MSTEVWAVFRNDQFPALIKTIVWTAKEAELEIKRLNKEAQVQVHYCQKTVLADKPTLQEMLARIRTPEESLESLKSAGIVGDDGQLTEHYRSKKKKK